MPQGQEQLRPRVLGPCYSCGGFGHLSSEGQDSISFMSAVLSFRQLSIKIKDNMQAFI